MLYLREPENLDFHHFYGLTELLETWLRKNKITIENEADILALRERFIAEKHAESVRKQSPYVMNTT